MEDIIIKKRKLIVWINYLQSDGRKLNKEEMSRANNLWNKYNNKPYTPDIKI